MTIGQSIRKARKERGYTLEALAKETGLPLTTIGNWEREEFTPTVTLLCCVADVFKISLDELIGRTPGGNGEWLTDTNGQPYCSECKARPLYMRPDNNARRVETPFCPRCGTRMNVD